MESQIKKGENELRSFRKLWWFILMGTGVYAILAYVLSRPSASDLTSQIGEGETFLALILACASLLEFGLSMWFPSEQRTRDTLLQRKATRPGSPSAEARRNAPPPSLLGSLMIGALFAESISINGLLLAFRGIDDNIGVLFTYGYLFMIFGAVALVLQRWRATRLANGILREMRGRPHARGIPRQEGMGGVRD